MVMGARLRSKLYVGCHARCTPSAATVGGHAGECKGGSPLSDSRGCSDWQLLKEREATKHMKSKTNAMRLTVVVRVGLLWASSKFV